MKKTKKKLMVTAVTAMLACTLSSGLVMTAFADEATKDHEFNDRIGDIVFEDFDRASLDGVVSTTTADKTDLGVKPYMHAEYEAMASDVDAGTRNAYIYKQGSGSVAKVKDSGALRITMRAPEGGVDIGDLCLGVRGGGDTEESVAVLNFSALVDTQGDELPALTADWSTYEISITMSYADEIYPTTTIPVTGDNSADMTGFHIFPVADKAGVVDIASVEFKTTGDYQYLNDFMGADNVQDTAKAIDSSTWWAGSDHGAIVKRTPTLTNGGDMTVVKQAAVGEYSYAVIEAEGDVEHLKVATTTDGTTFGEATAYDGYSVALTGEERGFKFTYDGEESVKIKRIYLTNLEVIVPATATPVIDATTAEMMDDFSVSQSGFTGVYEDMIAAPELEQANMYFRMSYSNGDKVNIADGVLTIEAPESGYTQFQFNSKTLHTGKYLVLKMKLDGEGANLNDFRFALMGENDAATDVVYANDLKSGVQYSSKLLDSSNPYKGGDWYYVIVDIAESGFRSLATGYSGMNIYYEGTGKLLIDEMFFADSLDYIITTQEVEAEPLELDAAADYAYAYMYVPNTDNLNTLCLDITPADDDFDISHLRLGFGRNDEEATIIGVRWASENGEGILYTRDGKRLDELTYTKGVATHIEIDLVESGITEAFVHVHVHRDTIGAFTISDVALKNYKDIYTAKELDTENVVVNEEGEKTFTPAVENSWEGAFGFGIPEGVYGKLELTLTPGAGFDITDLRFTGPLEYWFAQHEDVVITADGKTLADITFTEGTPVNIVLDLGALGVTDPFNEVYFHTNGTGTGAFSISNVKVTPYRNLINDYYAPAMAKLPLYLDSVLPTVSITNAATATVGDEITVGYTASDNATAASDLTVVVTVTKDGNAVTLDGNKFTAEEGVYTVTVKVTDIAGNEAEDVKQITVSKATPTPGDETGGKTDENTSLSSGAIAGIVVGCVAGVGLIALGAFFLVKHLRKKKENGNDNEKA